MNSLHFTDSLLILEIHPAFFSFAVRSSSSAEFSPVSIEMLNNYQPSDIDINQLSQWLKRHQGIWNRQYDHTIVALHQMPLTVVPENEGAADVLTALSGIEPSGYDFGCHPLYEEWIWSFAVKKELKALLQNYFAQPIIVPGIHGFAAMLVKHSEAGDQLGMYITPETVHFIQTKDGRPIFHNAFSYTNKEDLLYYVLLTYQNLQLDNQYHSLFVAGLIEEASPLYETLYQYIRNIKMIQWPVPIQESSLELTGFKEHAFLNLTGAAL